MRILALAAGLGAAVLLFAPGASAAATLKFSFEAPPEEVEVPQDGTISQTVVVAAEAREFACVQPATVGIQALIVTSFEKWAGASLNPRDAKFSIGSGEPGSSPKPLPSKTIRLEMDWDVDDRPRAGARQTYEIDFDRARGFQLEGGPCQPPPAAEWGPSVKITGSMPDILETTPARGECSVAPDLPECQTTAPAGAEGGGAPAVGSVLVMAALLAVAGRFRRRAP